MSMILVVEDDGDLLAGLVAGLARGGFETIQATDGETALTMISDLRPDLVLCDINIPKITGHALLLQVRQNYPDLARMPFIFLTALSSKRDILIGHALGADDYLAKPVDLEILLAVINKRLEQSIRWAASYESELERERAKFLSKLSEQTQLSFLSAADVLHHLAEGVLLLGQSGKVIFVNSLARKIIARDDGLSISDGILACSAPNDTPKLHRYIAQALGQSSNIDLYPFILPRPYGLKPYVMRCCRLEAGLNLNMDLGAGVAVFISSPEPIARPSEALLINRYGFTATEARISADLATGLSVSDIAKSHHISRNTVHHHLKSVFRKLNVTRQSELVSRILSDLAGLPQHRLMPCL